MARARRRFSREFKLEAVRQLAVGQQLTQVARELGVDATVLRRWKGQVDVDPASAFPGNGQQRAEEAELVRLRREVAQLRLERDFLKKAAVGSTGQCNAVSKLFARGSKAKGPSWAGVQLQGDGVEIGLAELEKVRSFGKVLAQQSVRVLVGPALPRTLGIAEVDRHVGRDGEGVVVREFHPAVPGQRRHHPPWELGHLSNQSIDDLVGRLAVDTYQHDKPRAPLHQRREVSIPGAREQVTLPVAGDGAVCHGRWPLADRHRVDDPGSLLPVGGRGLAASHGALAA